MSAEEQEHHRAYEDAANAYVAAVELLEVK
jgi:hypothetical protein